MKRAGKMAAMSEAMMTVQAMRMELAGHAAVAHLGLTLDEAEADPSKLVRLSWVLCHRSGLVVGPLHELHLDEVAVWRGWWDTATVKSVNWREESLTPWMKEALK